MPDEWLSVGVVVVKRASSGPFATHEWLPGTILPAAPPVAPWTSLGGGGGSESFYAGAADLQLHPAETAHYRDNLESPEPRIWVQLRPGPGPDPGPDSLTEGPPGLPSARGAPGHPRGPSSGEADLPRGGGKPFEIREAKSSYKMMRSEFRSTANCCRVRKDRDRPVPSEERGE